MKPAVHFSDMPRILCILILSCSILACKNSEEKYEATWESLSRYEQAPDWFRDAKFGMWAHWGPQCQPEAGDWYARMMYEEGTPAFDFHRKHYGHPSEVGFKDIICMWKADKWDPDYIVSRFKQSGAKYFMAMANHHDNLDLWDSKYHNWNSVRIGPKKNIIGGWAKAAKAHGLPFGVSVHSSHAWMFYETAQLSDKTGPMAGVQYDGKIKKENGIGTQWEGLDPQELYVQEHPLMAQYSWDWADTVSVPSEEYRRNFVDRTLDLVDRYEPDVVYFDDTALPFYPIGNEGVEVTAHIYNNSIAKYGHNRAVVTGKLLTEPQKDAIVMDVERGVAQGIQAKPWQTCTCLGQWHYDRALYERNGYKSAAEVIKILCDVISKNGNLLLSVPIRADGSIDEKEEAILDDLALWFSANSEAIYCTRPWEFYMDEGPEVDSRECGHVAEHCCSVLQECDMEDGFNTNANVRYVQKDGILYAHVWDYGKKLCLGKLASGGSVGDRMNVASDRKCDLGEADENKCCSGNVGKADGNKCCSEGADDNKFYSDKKTHGPCNDNINESSSCSKVSVVQRVSLLSSGEELDFTQNTHGLFIKLPEKESSSILEEILVLKIEF